MMGPANLNTRNGQSLLIVGLNPALQKIITLTKPLITGGVNRGASVKTGVGGKGQNAFVAASYMNIREDCKSSIAQFVGKGMEGDRLLDLLSAAQKNSEQQLTIRTLTECRTAITLVNPGSGSSTEIVEPSGNIGAEEIHNLLNKLSDLYSTFKVDGLLIMGSMPPNCPPNFYSQIIEKTCDSNSKVIIDSVVNVKETLLTASKMKCQGILKLNGHELCKLANVDALEINDEEGKSAVPTAILTEASQSLNELLVKENSDASNVYIACTDGPFPAFLINVSFYFLLLIHSLCYSTFLLL